jgi:hypothetical protein
VATPEAGSQREGGARTEDDAELRAVLREFQRLVIRYPFAAQALFSSLVQEGRRFAETEEGRRWAERLSDTDLLRQGRAVWEAVTLNVLEQEPDTVLPSKFLEAFVMGSKRLDLEAFLSSLFEARAGASHD